MNQLLSYQFLAANKKDATSRRLPAAGQRQNTNDNTKRNSSTRHGLHRGPQRAPILRLLGWLHG